MKERNESLDCLKGIAILLVMFGHVQVHNQMTDPYLYDVIKSLQMPLFFLVSGYLAGAGSRVSTLRQYGERMKKRALAYLVPFFAWLVLQHAGNIPGALRTVLFQLDYGLWFLMVLFLFNLLTCTAQLLEARMGKERGFWLVWFGGCVLILAVYLGGVTFLSPAILVTYLPYYTAAYAAGRHPDILGRIPIRWQRACVYTGGIVFLGMAACLDLVTVTGPVMLGVQTAASFLGCLAVVRLVLDWKPCWAKKHLAWLGLYTLEIYVVHYHFAAVFRPEGGAPAFWSIQGLAYSAAAFAFMSAVTAALVWLIGRIPPLKRLLFGKK